MKKIILYILGVAFFISCTDLNENPLDFVSPENTYDDIATFESMLIGSYKSFSDAYNSNMNMTAGNQAFGDNFEFTRYNVTTLNGNVYNLWSTSYELINNLNAIIENIEKAENGDDAAKNGIVGQAYFLRAISYFYLVRYFGDIPLLLEEVKSYSGIYNYLREDQEKVYEVILSDLKNAEMQLPDSWPGEPGKATKYAAKAVLAKVYLTMAGAPLKQTDKYGMAAAKAKEIIDANKFQLGDNYEDLFIPDMQNNHPAIIFQIPKVAGQGNNFSNPFYRSLSFLEGTTNPGMRIYGAFMENFPESPRKEVTFYMNSQPGVDAFVNGKNEDGTYINPEYHEINKDRKYFIKAGEAFAFTSKYSYIGAGEGLSASQESDQNVIVFRYAEILLMYAEAQARSEGSTNSTAIKAINDVRKRAYGVDTPIADGLTNEQFIDAVIQERYYELIFEMKRWFDVVRLELPMKFEIYAPDNSLTPTISDASNPGRYLMPIPQREIELNPKLTQNEGYN